MSRALNAAFAALALALLGLSLLRFGPEAALERARALLENGDAEGAFAALRPHADGPDAGVSLALGDLYLGGHLLRGEDTLARAAAAYRRAGELDPGESLHPAALGWALLLGGQFAGAEAAFRQALALDPHNQEHLLGLGEALEGAGKAAEALAAYRRADAIKPDPRMAAGIARLGGE